MIFETPCNIYIYIYFIKELINNNYLDATQQVPVF